MDKIRVAVIGCGSISDIYMSNIKSGKFQILELVGCSDLFPAAAQAKAEKYGCKAMTTEEICADPSIDMVINLTIPAAHYPVLKQCLEAGKHANVIVFENSVPMIPQITPETRQTNISFIY